MRTEQGLWSPQDGWTKRPTGALGISQLVLVLGGTDALLCTDWRGAVRQAYPHARLFGCSTAGEIAGTRVLDDTIVVTAMHFDHTPLETAAVAIGDVASSAEAGQRLGQALARDRSPTHVFVLSDGLHVNGEQLARGLAGALPRGVQVTGGLAGDGARFEKTLVLVDDAPVEGHVTALGLFGDAIRIGYGSMGGWDPFGPERRVTRAEGNVLYELDGKPALELYKSYLGEHAAGLPATGLRFPLSVRRDDDPQDLVRTILAVDEAQQSLTFAGDVPQGARARLMKSNMERLIDGAVGAAEASCAVLGKIPAEVAILISCVGRKLVLQQRTEEEVEGVQRVLGPQATLTGFYSYGEICPTNAEAGCELHNQTMTVTTLAERL